MGLGGRYDRDAARDDDAVAVIRRAHDLGIDFFDTAEVYGAGHGEEVLGRAAKGRRARMIIATKFSQDRATKADIVAACEGSLRRLGTDYIDLYQNHWPNPATGIEATAAAFEALISSGKVRAVGFSNTPTAIIGRARAALPQGFPVASVQQEFSLIERFAERICLPFCRRNGMALLAYSPLAQGRLAGDKTPALAALAARHGTTPSGIALQWLVRRAGVIPIPMSSKIENLEANVKGLLSPVPEAALAEAEKICGLPIEDIQVDRIRVMASHTGKYYTTIEDARANTLGLSPTPAEIALELADGEMLKPIKVRRRADDPSAFDLYEGQMRYWAWRIAHDDRLPIPAQVAEATSDTGAAR